MYRYDKLYIMYVYYVYNIRIMLILYIKLDRIHYPKMSKIFLKAISSTLIVTHHFIVMMMLMRNCKL